MPDGFKEFEAVLGALSKMTADETRDEDLLDARCPKCEASEFVKIPDLFDQARAVLDDPSEPPEVPFPAGLDAPRIVARFAPPQRRSPTVRIAIAAVIVGAIAFAVYRRFGETPGEMAAAGGVVIVVMVALTTARKLSDDYYDRRSRWRKLYMCRKCGQLVSP